MKEKEKCEKLQDAMDRLDSVVKDLEDIGVEIFGIVADTDESGLAINTVCKSGDDGYWKNLGFAMSLLFADDSGDTPFRINMLTSVTSAMCFAAYNDDGFRGTLKDIIIPQLKRAVKDRSIKVSTGTGKKGGTVL